MEAFEITFFCSKSRGDIPYTDDFAKSLRKYIQLDNEIQFDRFDDDKDYYEIRCCIFGLVLEESKFKDFAESVGRYAEYIFGKYRSVEVVTGIYEITYYYTENITGLSEFTADFLKKFPLVFVKNPEYFNSPDVLYKNSNIICLYHRNAQDLFSCF